jgi:hypothetical protein
LHEKTPRLRLLEHAWTHHLRRQHPPIDSYRVCWCGKACVVMEHWEAHLVGLDVQAHYLAHTLGITP